MPNQLSEGSIAIHVACAFTLGAACVALPLRGDETLAKTDTKERFPSAITVTNAKHVREYVNLERNGWEVHWQPDGKAFAVVQWKQPVQFVSRSMFTDLLNRSVAKKATHFAFSLVDGVFAYNDGPEVTVVRNMKEKVAVDGGGDQPKMAFSPDGKHLVTSRYGLEVKMWSAVDGSLVRTFKVDGSKGGLTAKFSPDGKVLAVGSHNFDRASRLAAPEYRNA